MPDYRNVPAEMKAVDQWVLWGVPGAEKPKEPWSADGLHRAKANDPQTWSSFSDAVACVPAWATGIGFEFGLEPSGFVGIDMDHVLHDDELDADVEEWLERLGSYTELSPSGDGLHVFMRGFMPPELKTGESGIKLGRSDPYQIEIYDCKRYFTVTGNVYGRVRPLREYDDDAQTEITDFCEWLHSIRKNRDEPSSVDLDTTPQDDAPADDGCLNFDDLIYTDEIRLEQTPTSNADWLQIGLEHDEKLSELYNRTEMSGDESSHDLALLNKLTFWLNRDPIAIKAAFEQSPYYKCKDGKHNAKWNRKADPYDDRTIRKAIAGCTETAAERNAAYQAQRAAALSKPADEEPASGEDQASDEAESKFNPLEPFDDPLAQMLPAFPVDELPPFIKGYALSVATCFQVSPDMVCNCILSAFALAVGGLFKVNVKPGWAEPLNLFILTIAPPSERKSVVLAEVTEPLKDFEMQENEIRQPEIQEYQTQKAILERQKAGLIEAMGKPKKADGKCGGVEKPQVELESVQQQLDQLQPVKPFRLLAIDATQEALTSLLAENNARMGVFAPEGGGLFDIMTGRYSERANFDVYLCGYSGDDITVDRKGRPSESIRKPALTLCLMAQPKVLADIMANSNASGRGLLARFLYSIPASTVGNRVYEVPDIDPRLKAQYTQALTDLLSLQTEVKAGEKPALIRLSPEAAALSKQFHDQLEPRLKDDLEDIQAWAGKYHGQVIRIAGILHCMAHGFEAPDELLSGETMASAIKIGEYYLAHSMSAFRHMGTEENDAVQGARYIWRRLKASREGWISKGKAFDLCHGRFATAKDMKPSLDELVRRGYIHVGKYNLKKTGRPAELISINPEANPDIISPLALAETESE